MKVTFEWPIRTLSGINFDRTLVYRAWKNSDMCTASVFVYPRITEHNHRQGSKLKQANILYKTINTAFIDDLKRYAHAYERQLCSIDKLYPNFYNFFIKALCNGAVHIEHLESLEKFVGIFGNNIEAWIANGLLPKVKAKFLRVAVWVGVGSEGFVGKVTESGGVEYQVLCVMVQIIDNEHKVANQQQIGHNVYKGNLSPP